MSPERIPDSDALIPSYESVKFDNATFKMLFKEHFTPLCAYCEYRFGFDLDMAKEAVHTSFIRFWENRTAGSIVCQKAYLYKIVTNVSLDIIKHQRVQNQHQQFAIRNTQDAVFTSDYESADFKELKNDIDRAIAELPEQMQIIFKLSRYNELRYSDIAKHLEISVKTVETQMSRALVKLRQKLAQYLAMSSLICLSHLF